MAVNELQENIVASGKTIFNILNFQIAEVFMKIPADNKKGKLHIAFDPSGKYDSSTGIYTLIFSFIASDIETDKLLIKIVSITSFGFEPDMQLEELPDYFY
ncbi:MAG: hypothetical protein ABIQ74_11515, partial [Chitinophagales bacterium]